MNNDRRKEIKSIIEQIEELKSLVESIKDAIIDVNEQETEYYDNMPEGLQLSDRGSKAEEAMSNLEDASSQMDDIDFDSIIGALETAAE